MKCEAAGAGAEFYMKQILTFSDRINDPEAQNGGTKEFSLVSSLQGFQLKVNAGLNRLDFNRGTLMHDHMYIQY